MTHSFQTLEQKNSYLSIHFLLPTNFQMPPSLLSVTPEEMDSLLQIAARVFQAQETNIQDALTDKIISKRLEVLENKHQQELRDARKEIELRHTKELADLRRSLNENEAVLRSEKRSLELVFEKENKELRFRLADVEASLTAARTLYDQIQSNSLQEMNRREQQMKDTCDELYAKIISQKDGLLRQKEERLAEAEQALQQKTLAQNNSSKRGLTGETDFLALVEQYTQWTLEHTGKLAHNCDYRANIHDLGVFFEIKNYTHDVPSKEVLKFQRDLKEHKEIHAGVFVSLLRRITGKTSTEDDSGLFLDWTPDNQLCIYISNFLSLDIPMIFFFLEKTFSILQIYNRKITSQRSEEHEQVAHLQSRIDMVKHYLNNTIARINNVLSRMRNDQKQIIERLNENYIFYVNELKQQIQENETAIQILLGQTDSLEAGSGAAAGAAAAGPKKGGRKKTNSPAEPSQ